MSAIRKTITIGERQYQLLFSVTIGLIAERKGIRLVLEDTNDKEASFRFFVSLIYLAALNGWEFMSIDDPSLGECPLTAMEVAEWATLNDKEFAEVITFAGNAMAGLYTKDKTGDVKKK